jgi:hypothetical protein
MNWAIHDNIRARCPGPKDITMTNGLVGESARYRYFSDDGMGRRSGVLIIAPDFRSD